VHKPTNELLIACRKPGQSDFLYWSKSQKAVQKWSWIGIFKTAGLLICILTLALLI